METSLTGCEGSINDHVFCLSVSLATIRRQVGTLEACLPENSANQDVIQHDTTECKSEPKTKEA